MKKIIYSLVIMIAAGSLFTSCIENVEPVGIQELRLAKADYLDALAQLRLADAELQKANAAYRLAEEALVRAKVEAKLINNKILELEYELAAASAQLQKDSIAALIEKLKEDQKAIMAQAKTNTAEAEEALRVALAKIEAAKTHLTADEASTIQGAITRYKAMLAKYNDAVEDVTAAEDALWNAKYTLNEEYDYEALYTAGTEYWAKQLEMYVELLDNVPQNPDVEKWAAELQKYQDSIDALNYSRYQIEQDEVNYMVNTYHENFQKVLDEIEALADELPTNGNLANVKIGNLVKEYPVPKKFQSLALFARSLAYGYMYASYGDSTFNTEATDTPFIGFEDGNLKVTARYANKNTILDGGKAKLSSMATGDKEDVEIENGLNQILETLEREWVVLNETTTDVEDLEKDAAKAKKNYEDTRAILEGGLKPVEDATKVALKGFQTAAEALLDAVEDFQLGFEGVNRASQADTAALISAIQAYVVAKNSYIGEPKDAGQDTLTYMGNISLSKIPVSEIVKDGFVQVLKSGTDGGSAAITVRALYGGAPDNYDPYNVSPVGSNYNNYNRPAFFEEASESNPDAFTRVIRTLLGGLNRTNYVLTTALTPSMLYANGYTLNDDYKVVESDFVPATEVDYRKAACAFWGLEYDVTNWEIVKNFPLNFSVATFTEPSMIVFFKEGNVLYNEKLGIVLENLQKGVEAYKIYKFNDIKQGELVDPLTTYFDGSMLFKWFEAQQKYEAVANKATNREFLDSFAQFIETLNADFESLATTYQEKLAAEKEKIAKYKAAMTELTGKPGTIITSNAALKAAAKDGKWNLGGAQLEIANKYLPDYPAKKQEWADRTKEINDVIEDLTVLKGVLGDAYAAAIKVYKYQGIDVDGSSFEEVLESYNDAVAQYKEDLKVKLNNAEDMYQQHKYMLERFKAGFDPMQTAIEVAENDLAEAEAALATAEKELALVKAEYDAIIAKYIK